MAETSDEIKNQIDAQRDRLGDNLHELERRVKDTTDWRAHMEKRPWVVLGIAFGAGVALSGILSRSGSSSYSSSYSSAYSGTPASTTGSRFTAFHHQRRRAGESLDKMTGALIAVGVQRLQDALCQAIPGFREKCGEAGVSEETQRTEYDRPQSGAYNTSPTPAM